MNTNDGKNSGRPRAERVSGSSLLKSALCAGLACLILPFGCGDPRNQLQTVVQVGEGTVVVRYEDGRLAEVLNDMDYELAPDQEVKVVENCDGRLHVVVAYAVP